MINLIQTLKEVYLEIWFDATRRMVKSGYNVPFHGVSILLTGKNDGILSQDVNKSFTHMRKFA